MFFYLVFGAVLGFLISLLYYYYRITNEWYIHYPLLLVFLIGLSYALERQQANGVLALIGMATVISIVIGIKSKNSEQ